MASLAAQTIVAERKAAYVSHWLNEEGRYRTARPLKKQIEVYSIPGLATLALLLAPVYLAWQIAHGKMNPKLILIFLALWAYRGFGITVGFHRLTTHKSFETNWLVRAILYSGGSAAAQGRIGKWRADHEDHHRNPDRVGDPHSPLLSLWHAHFAWLLHNTTPNLEERVEAMKREDPILRFMHKTYGLWFILSFVIPACIAGWKGVFWSWASLGWVYHITFSVNSVCHRFGTQPFNTGDLSTDHLGVGILGLGEGFHNGHHAFPWSALHALRYPWADLSYLVIRLLAFLRLAKNVRVPNKDQIARKRIVA